MDQQTIVSASATAPASPPSIADALSDKLLANDPEFVAMLERIRVEGPKPELLDQAIELRRRKLAAAAEKAAADAQNQRRDAVSKMSTSEKLAMGLTESKPARSGQMPAYTG